MVKIKSEIDIQFATPPKARAARRPYGARSAPFLASSLDGQKSSRKKFFRKVQVFLFDFFGGGHMPFFGRKYK